MLRSSEEHKRTPQSRQEGHPSGWYPKAVITALVAVALGLLLYWKGYTLVIWGGYTTTAGDWDSRRQDVKEAFISNWDAYTKYAWGYDQFHPLSKKGTQMTSNGLGDGLGWIIVDSLDTLMIMNLTSQLSEARKWVSRNLTYDQDRDVNTFETTIRMLGGLLSAHYLSTQIPDVSSRRDYIYLSKAVDLADRLLGAYESQSGVPYPNVNLKTMEGSGRATSIAEACTVQLEMKYIAHLTGKEKYWRKVERVIQVLDDNGMEDGLLPIPVNTETGKFKTAEIHVGSRGDSYYEYLIKQYLQTLGDEPIYLEMWTQALDGIKKHLVTSTKFSHLHFVAELPSGIGGPLSPKMDHLACFLPGTIALAATGGLTEDEARSAPGWGIAQDQQMQLARELMKTCWGMYHVTKTGLAPEIVWFEAQPGSLAPFPRSVPLPRSGNSKPRWKMDYVIKQLDAHNLQRPETVESLFIMWRITKDSMYRKWGWKIFTAFQKHAALDNGEGHSSLNSVNHIPPQRRDNMEGFWLSETLKYLYLLFSPADFLPLTDIVFNTEGHIFPRFKSTRFKTGWERKRGVQYKGRI